MFNDALRNKSSAERLSAEQEEQTRLSPPEYRMRALSSGAEPELQQLKLGQLSPSREGAEPLAFSFTKENSSFRASPPDCNFLQHT